MHVFQLKSWCKILCIRIFSWRNFFVVAKFRHGGVKDEYDTHLCCSNVFWFSSWSSTCFWNDVLVGIWKEELKLHMYIDVVYVVSKMYMVHCTWYIHMCLSRCIFLFIDLCRLCHTCFSTCVDCGHTFYIDCCVNCIAHFMSTCCWCRMLHNL